MGDKGEGGVKNLKKMDDVNYGRPPREYINLDRNILPDCCDV